MKVVSLGILLFIFGCSYSHIYGVIEEASTSGGGGPAAFSDSFDTNGDVTSSADWDAMSPYDHPVAAGGSFAAPVGGIGANAIAWANPSSVDTRFAYQEIEIQPTSNTPTSGLVSFVTARFDTATASGYACTLSVDSGTGLYEGNVMRFDNYFSNPANAFVIGPTQQSAINSAVQQQTPFLFGCEVVDVSGSTHIKLYLGSDINLAPALLVDYVLGTDVVHDSSPYTADGSLVFGLYNDTMGSGEMKVNSYKLYDTYSTAH